ncbi:MAG TPA: hypothetical protein VGR37_18115 [Longimicrobiaceae bacterium]|nr:hypothetical protein [Longimicrobiaceae bacterium]
MAYAVIQFVEAGERKATLCRTSGGEPTGARGVMDALSAFIEESSPILQGQGSPGALQMAMLFVAREREAGQEIRVMGGEGALGITPEEVQALDGRGYFYEAHFGRLGERSMPLVLQHALEAPRREDGA